MIRVILVLAFSMGILGAQSEVWVSPSGDDVNGDGSVSAPFRSVQRGVDVVATGGSVRVLPGSYPTPFTVTRAMTIAGSGGRATLGPTPFAGVIALVLAPDVTLRGLDFVGAGPGRGGVRVTSPAQRVTIADCGFRGLESTGVEITVVAANGFRLEDLHFEEVRNAGSSAAAVRATGAAGLVIRGMTIVDGDLGIRTTNCPGAALADVTCRDLRQAAWLASGCAGATLTDARITRAAQHPRPLLRLEPNLQLGAIALTGSSDAARLTRVVVEHTGGFVADGGFPSASLGGFDGLFGVAIADSAGVTLEDCTLRHCEFGGVLTLGTTLGVEILRANLVDNGARNRSAADVAVFNAAAPVLASGCFWGLPQGPANDGAGPGNGIAGPGIVTVPTVSPRAHVAPEFRFPMLGSVAFGATATALAIADVDGDGRDDLLAALPAPGRVAVALATSSGFATPLVVVTIGGRPADLAVGRFDGDAALDLAIADEDGDRVVLAFGDGLGGFPTTTSLAVPRRPVALDVGRVDAGDGDDLCVASRGDPFTVGGLTVIDCDGAGGIVTRAIPGAAAPADAVWIDLDGLPGDDLAAYDTDPVAPALGLWRTRLDGSFDPRQVVAAAVAPVSDARLAALRLGPAAESLAVGTFALTPTFDAELRLFRNGGAANLTAPVLLDSGTGPWLLAAARYGDRGPASLAWARPSAGRVVALGVVEPAPTTAPPHAELLFDDTIPVAIAAGDVDGDGIADLAIHDGSTGEVLLRRGARAAELERSGAGCTGWGGGPIPSLRARAEPVLGARTFGLTLLDVPANAPSFLLVDIRTGDTPIVGACRLLLVDPFTLFELADPSGAVRFDAPVPIDLGLVGNELFFQGWAIDVARPGLTGLVATDRLRVRVGG